MIIAIDPGKISGIAVYDGSSQFRTYEHDVQSTIRFVDNVWHQLHGDIEVVSEKFTISEKTRDPDRRTVGHHQPMLGGSQDVDEAATA